MLHWARRAIRAADQASGRTWFGTLTLNQDAPAEIDRRARLASPDPNADWWDDVRPASYFCRKRNKVVHVKGHICDHRFGLIRDQLVLEMRRYWARLRKAGHRFDYFLVFERHKSGEPHMHVLVHEAGDPIRKRVLQDNWALGFTNFKLVGSAKRQVAPNDAAFYVAKYLSKSTQARQIASKGYGNKCALAAIAKAKPERDGVSERQ